MAVAEGALSRAEAEAELKALGQLQYRSWIVDMGVALPFDIGRGPAIIYKRRADSSTATTYYNGLAMALNTLNNMTSATSYELPLYTERGSKITGVSLTDVSVRVANHIGQPTFTFAGASTTQGSESSETWTAKEGDTKTLVRR